MKTVVCFATPEELAAWIDEWRVLFGLEAGVVTYHPQFELRRLEDAEGIRDMWKPENHDEMRVDEIWLSVDPLDLDGHSGTQIRGNNRDSLIIRTPEVTPSSIGETDIGSVSTRPEYLKTWKKLVSNLKQRTKSGMWVLNRGMRIKGFYKDKLYSAGVLPFLQQGGRLTNLTGLEVFVDEPQF